MKCGYPFVLEEDNQIEMSENDLSFFIETIKNPPPPNDRLKKEVESLKTIISRMDLGGNHQIHNVTLKG